MVEIQESEFANLIKDDETQEKVETSNLTPASTPEILEAKLTENAKIQ